MMKVEDMEQEIPLMEDEHDQSWRRGRTLKILYKHVELLFLQEFDLLSYICFFHNVGFVVIILYYYDWII